MDKANSQTNAPIDIHLDLNRIIGLRITWFDLKIECYMLRI